MLDSDPGIREIKRLSQNLPPLPFSRFARSAGRNHPIRSPGDAGEGRDTPKGT
jgi:hypothetical protein